VLLKCFGYRQRQSWLGYRAVKRLGELVRPDWTLLEIGSGMSSLFFARRCRRLVEVESDAAWYEQMQRLFARERVTKVDYRLRGPADYKRIDDYPDQSFDLAIIDGLVLDQAACAAIRGGGLEARGGVDHQHPVPRVPEEHRDLPCREVGPPSRLAARGWAH
jgi:hypothetical protein